MTTTTTKETELPEVVQKAIEAEVVRGFGVALSELGEQLMTPLKHWRFDLQNLKDITTQGPRPVMFTVAATKDEAIENFRAEWNEIIGIPNFSLHDLSKPGGALVELDLATYQLDFDTAVEEITEVVWIEDVPF